MSETNLPDKKNEEIDLVDLFRRIGRSFISLFKFTGRAFLVSIAFLFRYWLPLLFSIVLGITASYFLKSALPKSYSTSIVLKTNSVTPEEMIRFVNRLHFFCQQKNKPALMNAMNLTDESVAAIEDIGAFWVIDKNRDNVQDYVDYSNKHNVYDTIDIRMQDRLSVRIKAKSPEVFADIRDGIINFIDKDSLFRLRNRVRLRQNNYLISRLDYDIIQLDSLQKVKYFEETKNNIPKTGGQIVFLQEQRTQLVYSDIYALLERKQQIEYQQTVYKDIVTVISDITKPLKPYTGTLYYAVLLLPLTFGLTVLIIILLRNRKKLKEVYEKYK